MDCTEKGLWQRTEPTLEQPVSQTEVLSSDTQKKIYSSGCRQTQVSFVCLSASVDPPVELKCWIVMKI